MKITLSSRGSRGDVYPVIQIASVLKAQGHDVRLCVPPFCEALAQATGATVRLCSEDADSLMREMGAGWQAARDGLTFFQRSMDEQFELLLAATADADALVTSVNELAAPSVAEYRGIPHFRVAYAPVLPGPQPPPLLPYPGLPAWLNRLIWRGLNSGITLLFGRRLNRHRAALGLGPAGNLGHHLAAGSHTLLAINATLGPPHVAWRYPYSYTGYCFGQDEGPLDPALEAFLQAGPPPIYLGFGSVHVPDPIRFLRQVLNALARVGCRAVIGRGWCQLGGREAARAAEQSGQVHLTDDTPHATLFPWLAGVAHHGGSGTVHSAARAGLPQFVMPQLADQFYWGHRIHCLGLGPAPVPPSRITGDQLARRLEHLLSDSTARQRAADLALEVRREGGAEAAAALILQTARERKRVN